VILACIVLTQYSTVPDRQTDDQAIGKTGVYTIQQTSSKLLANVFKIHVLMLDVC